MLEFFYLCSTPPFRKIANLLTFSLLNIFSIYAKALKIWYKVLLETKSNERFLSRLADSKEGDGAKYKLKFKSAESSPQHIFRYFRLGWNKFETVYFPIRLWEGQGWALFHQTRFSYPPEGEKCRFRWKISSENNWLEWLNVRKILKHPLIRENSKKKFSNFFYAKQMINGWVSFARYCVNFFHPQIWIKFSENFSK